MLHGVYSTWGPFADFFNVKEGVDVIIYAQTLDRFGSFLLSRHARQYELIASSTWEEFKQTPLTEEEEQAVDATLAARAKSVLGPRVVYKDYIKPGEDKEPVMAELTAKEYARRYIMYPNLAWDACLEGGGSDAFRDIFEWLDVTIGYFIEHPEYQLVIKTHPAELVWEKCTVGVAEYISKKYPDLPDNIYILMPDTPLTAYDLVFPDIICLVFNGTTGLELATQGIPVLAGGKAHYIYAGVVINIKTKGEYLSHIENPERLREFGRQNQKLAKKYAYFYFHKLMIRMPFYQGTTWGDIDWDALRRMDEILDDNGTIMNICRRLADREDVVLPFN